MPKLTIGAKLTMFTREMVSRISGAFGPQGDTPPQPQIQPPGTMAAPPPGMAVVPTSRPMAAPGTSLVPTQRREPWFGPGEPMRPIAPAADVAGRALDYPTHYNMSFTPRAYEGVGFPLLRTFADFDMVRLAIETRKDQMCKLEWSVLPRIRRGGELRAKQDQRCTQLEDSLRYPDKRNTWHNWLRLLMEEQLAIDAPAIYVRRDVGGQVYSLDVIDGTTIVPKLDVSGRQPLAPEPAYQQVIKGMPAINYSAAELIYAPRNPRAAHVYGMSPTEQIILTVNVAIRRESSRLSYFTEGNVPDALIGVPNDWAPDTIRRFQEYWDAMLTDPNTRRKAKFVPGGTVYQPTRSDQSLMDTFDEWLARVICYAFSLPALPFVRMQNRATADTAYETALEEGLQPMMTWFKAIMDRIIQQAYGYDDLEFVWDTIEKVDPEAQQQRDMAMIQVGLKSIDEVRVEMGLDPIGMPACIFGGPNGVIFIDDLLKAKAQGLTAIAPPPQPGMMPGMAPPGMPPGAQPGDPGFVDQGGAQQPPGGPLGIAPPDPRAAVPRPPAPAELVQALSGVPASLLAAVGLGPAGPAGRKVNVTAADAHATDPMRHLVPHPQVLSALRDAERRHGRQGSARR